jgi:hypothetical protein
MSQPLSTRATWAYGRRQVSWLPGLPLRAFPIAEGRIGGLRMRAAVSIPGHSGGSAPESHRLPFTTDRYGPSESYTA